jgi:hypothetical protein
MKGIDLMGMGLMGTGLMGTGFSLYPSMIQMRLPGPPHSLTPKLAPKTDNLKA